MKSRVFPQKDRFISPLFEGYQFTGYARNFLIFRRPPVSLVIRVKDVRTPIRQAIPIYGTALGSTISSVTGKIHLKLGLIELKLDIVLALINL
jgi:hypothetical protein